MQHVVDFTLLVIMFSACFLKTSPMTRDHKGSYFLSLHPTRLCSYLLQMFCLDAARMKGTSDLSVNLLQSLFCLYKSESFTHYQGLYIGEPCYFFAFNVCCQDQGFSFLEKYNRYIKLAPNPTCVYKRYSYYVNNYSIF